MRVDLAGASSRCSPACATSSTRVKRQADEPARGFWYDLVSVLVWFGYDFAWFRHGVQKPSSFSIGLSVFGSSHKNLRERERERDIINKLVRLRGPQLYEYYNEQKHEI